MIIMENLFLLLLLLLMLLLLPVSRKAWNCNTAKRMGKRLLPFARPLLLSYS